MRRQQHLGGATLCFLRNSFEFETRNSRLAEQDGPVLQEEFRCHFLPNNFVSAATNLVGQFRDI